jgi:hypothetical protein
LTVKEQNNIKVIDPKKKCDIGEYLIEWRRAASSLIFKYAEAENDDLEDLENDKFTMTTRIKLPTINVEFFPFLIETNFPASGSLDEKLVIQYKIKNITESKILELECTLNENEFFSIAGNKLVN